MKFAHYDKKTFKLLGWYDNELHQSIPKPNIKITDNEWKKALSINANCIDKENNKVVYLDKRTEEERLAINAIIIKEKAKKIIYEKYSQEKQNNIAFLDVGDQERIAAIDWINNIRAIAKKAILENVSVNEINWEA